MRIRRIVRQLVQFADGTYLRLPDGFLEWYGWRELPESLSLQIDQREALRRAVERFNMLINVTQGNIDRQVRHDRYLCAIAAAASQTFGQRCRVENSWLLLDDGRRFSLPRSARDFMWAEVQYPFSFMVAEIPEEAPCG